MSNDTLGSFKVGDVVKLKSGGSTMTVEKVEGDDITCAFKHEDGQMEREVFKSAMLKIIPQGMKINPEAIITFTNSTTRKKL
jgi:uncharacterized protein YodC (DUF2158 family)